ncbi:hypothetical protein OS493_005575 [Desmophyllum pertusum]|uniref:Uncharacterized protein n=1 Tax=Desmophyllum pertusum TaxID=174260 RepID=A0A9W9YSI3_9CNID|nr:hypothetical protein OS493_005575 [Desmophyllum pertusum]
MDTKTSPRELTRKLVGLKAKRHTGALRDGLPSRDGDGEIPEKESHLTGLGNSVRVANVSGYAGYNVGDNIGNNIGDSVGDNTCNNVGDNTGINNVVDNIGNGVGDNVYDNTSNNTGDNTGSNVCSHLCLKGLS